MRDGCCAVIALVEPDWIVGLTYGFTSSHEGWFGMCLDPALDAAGVQQWGEDAFEFVELAVLPESRKRGVAGRMHDRLFSAMSH